LANSAGPAGPGGNASPWDNDGYDCWGTPLYGPQEAQAVQCLGGRIWARVEYLMWFPRGAWIPPLLTSGTTASGGVIGQTGTTIVLGDETLNHKLENGGRVDLGFWLDAAEDLGLEGTYFGLAQGVQHYDVSSTGTPLLARPFFNADKMITNPSPPPTLIYDGGQNDALVIAGTGSTGSFAARSSSGLEGGDLMLRWALLNAPAYRVDMLAGYRVLRLDDDLKISDTSTLTATGDIVNSNDEFATRNYFNGVELGMKIEQHVGRWSLESLLKLGMGDTHSIVYINGYTIRTPSGDTALPPDKGGLLALPSNMGTYGSDRFSMAPELGVTLGCDLTRRLRATLGYTFLYWGGVARPGDQIDLVVNGDQIPPPNTSRTAPTPQPNYVLHTTDYWAQGLNFGLDYRF
jgi:hypothetical protein